MRSYSRNSSGKVCNHVKINIKIGKNILTLQNENGAPSECIGVVVVGLTSTVFLTIFLNYEANSIVWCRKISNMPY